jgi:aminopeptidase YwaD
MKQGYILSLLLISITASAQTEKRWIKHQIATLSGPSMHGRGYINKGGDKAANYIRRKFQEFGILAFDKDSSYYQKHSFPINTFPGNVYLRINRKELEPGVDYIVHAASKGYNGEKQKLHKVDLAGVKDSTSWAAAKTGFRSGRAYLLKNADTPVKYLKLTLRSFAKELPEDLYIVPKHGKLTWLACTEQVPATIIYVEDTVTPRWMRKVKAQVDVKFVPSFQSQNVLGYVPGTVKPDSFIVFTAHYDHLGRMGQATLFPGAHDNASGTSLVLYLASYFAQHPQPYSIAFMLFSGEEAGLIGSKYYASHPIFPLSNIRFVVNLDMTGDAHDGITIVNADKQEKEFSMLEKINAEKNYLPKINKRTQTQNSDHYSFSEKGVPAIFIYGNGTKPYYHDVFDKANEITLEHIDDLSKLLIEFTGQLSSGK